MCPEYSHLLPLHLVDQLSSRSRTLSDRWAQQRHVLEQETSRFVMGMETDCYGITLLDGCSV